MLQISNMILSSLVLLLLQILTTLGELIKDPTLKAIDPFSASGDAGIFKKEMKEDATTNRDKLVCIWFHRTYDQRKQINDFYNGNFCPVTWSGYYYSYRCPFWWGLIEISRHSMQKLYDLSLSSPSEILGETVYQALTGKWKEAGALEEILCANDPEMKKNITDYYQEVYKDTVENHLATFKKDDKEFQHVMQQYCRKGLCQDKKIKPEDVDKEAQALRFINPDSDKEGFKKKLNELLDKYCEPDMKMIFEKYRQDKNGIAEAVEKAFCNSKEAEKVYYRLVRYIENTCQFYANELHHAIDGIGTDIDKINRIILTRCERDLKCILDKYKETYGKTFTNDLKWDTSEDRYLTSIRYLCGKTCKE